MTGAARHAPRPHARIPTSAGIPDRSLRSAYNNALDEVALYNISDGAADTFRTTGDLLLPWMRKSDFRGALCPEQNSARCEASTFDAVGALFRLMIPVAVRPLRLPVTAAAAPIRERKLRDGNTAAHRRPHRRRRGPRGWRGGKRERAEGGGAGWRARAASKGRQAAEQ